MDERREQALAQRLIELATVMRYDRRQILKRAAALGLSAPMIATVLAACGDDDDDDDDTAADEPTATPEPAAGDPTPTETEEDEEDEEEPTPTEADEEETEEEEEPTPTEGEAVGRGGTINVPTTLGDSGIGNPILTGSEQWTEYLVFNKLVMFDDLGTLQPFLAESWEYSDDNLELTMNLAEANWHDGEPFTADDVIFTFDLVADENTDTSLRSRLQIGGEFITWEKVDDRTILLTLPEPFAPLLFNINSIAILPQHILEGQDVNTSDFNTNPIGTGPFRLTEWQRDQFIRFERNDDYFKSDVLADGYTVFFTEDANANIIALENGDLDMIFTPPEAQERFEDHELFNLNQYVYFTSITLAFNHSHPILSDLEVRKAVEMAVDKDSWTESVTRGRGIVSHNQYAESGPLDRYNNYDDITPPTFDPEAAAAALDEMGWTVGDDGIRQRDGERMSFNVITYAGFDEYQNGMVIFQGYMSDIGIEVTPNVVEYTTLEGMWADPDDDPNNRAFELEEWPHPFEFDPDVFAELHSSNHPPLGNYMWYANDEADRLIEAGRVETDPDARVQIYQDLDVVRAEDLPCIPLYLAVDAWVVSKRIRNRAGEEALSPYYRQYRLSAVDELWKADA